MKNGVCAPERLIYIHYPKELWSKAAPPTIKQSMTKIYHYRDGMLNDQTSDMIATFGRVVARKFPCPCKMHSSRV